MKFTKILLALSACSLFRAAFAYAQQSDGKHSEFIYDLGFDLRFDNREYTPSDFSESGTIFGTRFYPTIGLRTGSEGSKHSLIGGAEIRKDFGNINDIGAKILSDFFYYYRYDYKEAERHFSITGGVFPRTKCLEQWSTAFISEKQAWYDPYIEGVLFSYATPRTVVELGCDWMGKYGASSSIKEQFLIFSAGHHQISDWFNVGYNAYMVHFASSIEAPGVCDNALVEPYMVFDLKKMSFLDDFYLKLGYIQSVQRDRTVTSEFELPGLAELTMRMEKGFWGASNSLYIGKDIMPLYYKSDSAGVPYVDRLYFNDPFFRIYNDSSKCGSYDRLEFFYSRVLGGSLRIKVSAVFHFNNVSYSGSQQIVGFNYTF